MIMYGAVQSCRAFVGEPKSGRAGSARFRKDTARSRLRIGPGTVTLRLDPPIEAISLLSELLRPAPTAAIRERGAACRQVKVVRAAVVRHRIERFAWALPCAGPASIGGDA